MRGREPHGDRRDPRLERDGDEREQPPCHQPERHDREVLSHHQRDHARVGRPELNGVRESFVEPQVAFEAGQDRAGMRELVPQRSPVLLGRPSAFELAPVRRRPFLGKGYVTYRNRTKMRVPIDEDSSSLPHHPVTGDADFQCLILSHPSASSL